MLKRATSRPLSTRRASISGESVAGPIVAIILVRLMAGRGWSRSKRAGEAVPVKG